MPSLKLIRRRIASVKNTQKITKAMKAVAAARLRRAQEAVTALRPYATRLGEAVAEVSARAGEVHPLLAVREPKRVELIVLTSDRGLCGGFNANLIRRTERFLFDNREAFSSTAMSVIGRKGRDYFRRRGRALRQDVLGITGETALAKSRELARTVIEDYERDSLDAVYLIYNEFKSAMSQRVAVERLLPIEPLVLPEEAGLIDYKYEPGRREILDTLLPMYIETQIYRANLESIASEFGARMTAMDNATSNASDMIGDLTLQFNRARQAAITKELMEIVSGAEALKG